MSKKLFNDFIKLNRGFDLPNKDIIEGKYPVVASTSIKAYHKDYKIDPPCVVTGRSGSLGKVQYIKEKCWPLNTSLYVKNYKKNFPKYVYYFLQTMHLENYNSGAGVPTLNQNHLHKLRINIPKIEIQKKIAAALSVYDDLIENNNKRISILETMAEELYKEWFVRYRFPGYEKVKFNKGIPEGWEVKKIKEFVSFLSGYSFKSKTYVSDGKYGIVTIKNVQDGYFIPKCTDYIETIPDKMKKHCYLEKGDILMSLTGNVGRVCHVYGQNILLNQRVAKLKPNINNAEQFIYYMFKNKSMIQLIENLSLGSTAQMNLSPIVLGEQKMSLPNQDLLKKYSEYTTPIINEKICKYEENILLVSIRDKLLSRLMSGKIDVENMDIKFPPSMKKEVLNA